MGGELDGSSTHECALVVVLEEAGTTPAPAAAPVVVLAPTKCTSTVGLKLALAELQLTRISVGKPVAARRAPRGSFVLTKATGADRARSTGAARPPVASANVYVLRMLTRRAGSWPLPFRR